MRKKQIQRSRLNKAIADSAATILSLSLAVDKIATVSEVIIRALKAGGKILTAGNGGSAAESLHMAEEFTGRFRTNRKSLPAISLAADCTALTCIGNDFGYEAIFSRQVEGLGGKGDLLIIFSTSGNSPNLVRAMEAARKKKMTVISFLGRGGGSLAGKSDYEIIVESGVTERIQEAHQVLIHLILDTLEDAFPEGK